jgi:hypothetical protein
LLVDSVDLHDKLAVVMLATVLVAPSPPYSILALIHRLGLGLALVLVEVCSDHLLTEGMACHKVM